MTKTRNPDRRSADRPRFEAAIEADEFVIYDREQPRGWLSAERPMEVRR